MDFASWIYLMNRRDGQDRAKYSASKDRPLLLCWAQRNLFAQNLSSDLDVGVYHISAGFGAERICNIFDFISGLQSGTFLSKVVNKKYKNPSKYYS